MSLRLSTNKLFEKSGPTGPYPAPSQDPGPLAAVVPPRQSEAPAVLYRAVREADPILDIPTPQLRQIDTQIKRQLTKSSRRFYNRALLGLKLPGRYYFLTYTTAMTTPFPAGHYWRSLWKWHSRYRPNSCCCYGITREGKAKGVIHMIVRLGPKEKRMDVNELRAHWFKMTGAVQLKLVYVGRDRKKLASYISDQRKKRGLAGEMAWQDYLDRWRWTTGWLPKGFTKAYPRVWVRLMQLPLEVAEKAISDWVNACHVNPDKIKYGPWVIQSEKYGSELLTSNIKADVV